MVSSLFTASLLGLAAITSAAPSLKFVQDVFLMENMRQGVNTYYALNPPEDVEVVRRNLTDVMSTQRPAACEDVWVVFARGTFEPGSLQNLGMMVGIPFTSALKYALAPKGKSLGTIGVDYTNDVAGYLSGGNAQGGRTMAQMISQKVSQCPSTKIIAGGYSQGAQVAHNALNSLSSNVVSHVAAVVSYFSIYFIDPSS
jgi:hypothetical protein